MKDNISSKNKYFSNRVRHWDSIANCSFSDSSRYYHQYLEKNYQYLVPKGLRVLEIGCGKGELLSSVRPKDGIGVDQSEEMIRQARKEAPDLQFVHSRGEDVKLEGTFDVIILSDLLNDVWDVQELMAHLEG